MDDLNMDDLEVPRFFRNPRPDVYEHRNAYFNGKKHGNSHEPPARDCLFFQSADPKLAATAVELGGPLVISWFIMQGGAP